VVRSIITRSGADMNSFSGVVTRSAHRVMGRLVSILLRPGATYLVDNFRLWQSRGYHIVPVHFYSPIPDTRLVGSREPRPSDCLGIDLRVEAQLGMLRDVFVPFADEYNVLSQAPVQPPGFSLANDSFQGIDPHVYYCLVRHFKPRMVIEVGSGHSTLLGALAAGRNGSTRYVCIDPWPKKFVSAGVPGMTLIPQKVEDVGVSFFEQLTANDVLFVDSSHVVRTGGDVCFLVLEVLPRLKPGVLVHFHDIFLPFDYPRNVMTEDLHFWSEQYLLHAFIAENRKVEIIFANHFMTQTCFTDMRSAFPSALSVHGASFWIRKTS
jgi:hypothetical protein